MTRVNFDYRLPSGFQHGHVGPGHGPGRIDDCGLGSAAQSRIGGAAGLVRDIASLRITGSG